MHLSRESAKFASPGCRGWSAGLTNGFSALEPTAEAQGSYNFGSAERITAPLRRCFGVFLRKLADFILVHFLNHLESEELWNLADEAVLNDNCDDVVDQHLNGSLYCVRGDAARTKIPGMTCLVVCDSIINGMLRPRD